MYRVGKARKRFLSRPGHMREPASSGGKQENSLALQAPGCAGSVKGSKL